jgi:hypothetical protein
MLVIDCTFCINWQVSFRDLSAFPNRCRNVDKTGNGRLLRVTLPISNCMTLCKILHKTLHRSDSDFTILSKVVTHERYLSAPPCRLVVSLFVQYICLEFRWIRQRSIPRVGQGCSPLNNFRSANGRYRIA